MSDALMAPQAANERRSPWRLGCGLLAVVLVLSLAWIGFKAARTLPATRAVIADLQALQGADLSTLSSLDPQALRQMRDRFARLETNLATIQAEVGPWLPLARHLGWLPGVGAEVKAAPALLQIAGGVATAGRAALDGALPLADALKQPGDGEVMARALPLLQGSATPWQEAAAALETASAARASLDVGTLHPRLAAPMGQLDEALPLLQMASDMALLAPGLLGADQPRTYLLLAQNSDELRPTGGFISGVGEITLDRGRISGLTFQDGAAIYNPEVDHPPAPPALERYMKGDILLLRDANWSPDYPTTSAVAQTLYMLDTGRSTDGVIAFDLESARRVVAALGPLDLPGYEEQVTAENLVTAMRAVWEQPFRTDSTLTDRLSSDRWSRHRKDFMTDLAAAARARLESGDVDLARLAWAVRGALEEKHLLVSLNDPAMADILSNMNWNGRVIESQGDRLMVVDSNVGWNKVNAHVARQINYTVTPAADGSAEATLELVYQHQGRSKDGPCVHESRYGDTYEDMLERCYFDYVRVYVPRGAALRSTEGFEPGTVETLPGERGTTVFGGLLILPPGETRSVRLDYQLPAGVIVDDSYHLLVQKQPGTPRWPVRMTLVDPAGAWRAVEPPATHTDAGLEYALTARTDLEILAQRIR